MTEAHIEAATDAYLAGVAAVDPTVIVRRAVRQGWLDDWFESREHPKRLQVLALGKAAPRMLWGLVEAGAPFMGLGAAPRGVAAPGVDTFRWLPGGHPTPTPDSFEAGREFLKWVEQCPADAPVLVLLSGGASSCIEVPKGITTEQLTGQWKTLLHAGVPIEDMNRKRAEWSELKNGQLGKKLLEKTKRVRVWLMADTDALQAPATVGSAPFFQSSEPDAIPHRVLASTTDFVAAAGLRLASGGYQVFRHAQRIHSAVDDEVAAFLEAAEGLPKSGLVALVGGGEPTVKLPTDAPLGGRCQHAALVAASHLAKSGSGFVFMAAASDGVDGSSNASGAFADAGDWTSGAAEALAKFEAHPFLDRRGRLLHMGPTGTNVNDLWIALRGP